MTFERMPNTAATRHVSRRALVAGLAATGAAPLAAACGLPGSTPAAKQLAPATLTYTTFQLPPNVNGVAIEKALKDFETRNAGVTIKVEGLSTTVGGDLEKLQTMLASGTQPDASLTRQHHMGFFAGVGALASLDERIAKDRRMPKADFVPVSLDRVTWNGKIWS